MPAIVVATQEDDENPDLTQKAIALATEMSRRKIAKIIVTTDTGDAFTMTLQPTRHSGDILCRLDLPG